MPLADYLCCQQLLSPKTYPKFSGSVDDGIRLIFEALAISKTAYEVGHDGACREPESLARLGVRHAELSYGRHLDPVSDRLSSNLPTCCWLRGS